jgi:hypothetical protein
VAAIHLKCLLWGFLDAHLVDGILVSSFFEKFRKWQSRQFPCRLALMVFSFSGGLEWVVVGF